MDNNILNNVTDNVSTLEEISSAIVPAPSGIFSGMVPTVQIKVNVFYDDRSSITFYDLPMNIFQNEISVNTSITSITSGV